MMIIHNKWVATVRVCARRPSQWEKNELYVVGPASMLPVLSKTAERLVDRFDVMIRADIAIAVWRRTTAELGCSPPLQRSAAAPASWASVGKDL